MTLYEISEVTEKLARIVGGQCLRREFLQTVRGMYLVVNTVEDTSDFLLWTVANAVTPLLVSQNILPYSVGDVLVEETELFTALKKKCLVVQDGTLVTVNNGLVTNVAKLEAHAL